MSKWHGVIGFSIQTVRDPENHPSVYENDIVEKRYYGDLNRRKQAWKETARLNDDLRLNVELSILSNQYMTDNLGNIVYATLHGKAWKVTDIEERYPRVILTLGGLYNGKRPERAG